MSSAAGAGPVSMSPPGGAWTGGRRSWPQRTGGGGASESPRLVVGGVRAVRNGLAIKEILLRSQHQGTYLGAERDGSVLANRTRTLGGAAGAPPGAGGGGAGSGNIANSGGKQEAAAWTLEIFRVNERAELELKASREFILQDKQHQQEEGAFYSSSPLSSPRGGDAQDGAMAMASHAGGSSGFLPPGRDDSDSGGENVDVMYYFGFRSPLGRYLGLETVHPTSAPTSITPSPPTYHHHHNAAHPHHHQHHSSYPSYPFSSSSTTSSATTQPAAGTSATGSNTPDSRSPRSILVVNAKADEPTYDCLWVCYQIRRGVWGLKSQRGDGPWLGVEGETGELVLLDEQLPGDTRFFWGFTTLRKRIRLLSSQNRFLSAELNRTVIANRERAGHWETWIVERLPNNKVTLLGYHGYYLSGLNDGTVCANQGIPRESEQWEMVPIRKGVFGFKSVYSRFLSITPEKDGRVVTQAQSGPKAKRVDEWMVQKDYHLRKITKTLIPLSCVADIPLPTASSGVVMAGPGGAKGRKALLRT